MQSVPRLPNCQTVSSEIRLVVASEIPADGNRVIYTGSATKTKIHASIMPAPFNTRMVALPMYGGVINVGFRVRQRLPLLPQKRRRTTV